MLVGILTQKTVMQIIIFNDSFQYLTNVSRLRGNVVTFSFRYIFGDPLSLLSDEDLNTLSVSSTRNIFNSALDIGVKSLH